MRDSTKDEVLFLSAELAKGEIRRLNEDAIQNCLKEALKKAIEKCIPNSTSNAPEKISAAKKAVDESLLRACAISARTSHHIRQDFGASAAADVACVVLPVYCVAGHNGENALVSLLNSLLPANVRALSCVKLKGALHPVHDRTLMRYEYVIPIQAFVTDKGALAALEKVKSSLPNNSWHTFLLGTLVKRSEVETLGRTSRKKQRDCKQGGDPCPISVLRRTDAQAMVDILHHIYHFVENPDEASFAIIRRIKKLLKLFNKAKGGNKDTVTGFHNFCVDAPLPGLSSISRKVEKMFVKGRVGLHGQWFLVFSFGSKEGFVTGFVRRLVGLVVAMIRKNLPSEVFQKALSQEVLFDLGPFAAPPSFQMLTQCSFSYYETKHLQRLQPGMETFWHNSKSPALAQRVFNYRSMLLDRMAKKWLDNGLLANFCERIEGAVPLLNSRLFTPRPTADELILRAETVELCPPPKVYQNVLRLLREASASGQWPQSSSARQLIIVETNTEGKEGETTEGAKDQGGSFSLGSMPDGKCEPHCNKLFPELFEAVFELEKSIAPGRPPSSTIAINRNAQFRPHRDSGAGAGQLQSMIVGLGDYHGGELAVEGIEHDIRYKPIEFNGWTERHWTWNYVGERYSLVWFTPSGCEHKPGLLVSQNYKK